MPKKTHAKWMKTVRNLAFIVASLSAAALLGAGLFLSISVGLVLVEVLLHPVIIGLGILALLAVVCGIALLTAEKKAILPDLQDSNTVTTTTTSNDSITYQAAFAMPQTHAHFNSAADYCRHILDRTIREEGLLGTEEKRDLAHKLARENAQRWQKEAANKPNREEQRTGSCVRVISGDWGDVTLSRTKATGHTYAVLNMANAFAPGGAYLQGLAAQEENLFRRTDAHFSLSKKERKHRKYDKKHTALINGETKDPDNPEEYITYLDTAHPRVCVRGRDRCQRRNNIFQGYDPLSPQDFFEFYELRCAASDLRTGKTMQGCKSHMRRKIRAQLHTMHKHNIKHAILSAFGCGAFLWDAKVVAQLYKEELTNFQKKHKNWFEDITFAIYYPGYGKDNLPAFQHAFSSKEQHNDRPSDFTMLP